MRITNRTTSNNAIYNINEGRLKLDHLNEVVSSGKMVGKPSDDPVSAKKILDIESQIKVSKQYISNIKTATTWLEMTGTSMEGILDSVMSIRGVAGQAMSGLDDPVKKTNVLNQLKFFRDQLTDYPNVQVGSSYVFSGFNSNVPPFGKNTVTGDISAGSADITNIDTTNLYLGHPITGPGIPAGSIITAIPTPGVGGAVTISSAATATASSVSMTFAGTFNGTPDIVTMEIGKGVQVPVSVSGGEILRGGTPPGSTGVDIIKTLDTLILDITNNNSAGIQAANVELDAANQLILGTISDVGMRKSRMENAQNSQQRTLNVLSEMHDNMQNVDYSKAAIELTNQKTAFEAALSATAKIAPLSLLDYL